MIIASRNSEVHFAKPFVAIILLLLYVGSWIIGFDSTKNLSGCLLFWGIKMNVDKIYPNVFHPFRNYTYHIFLLGIFFHIALKIVYKISDFPNMYFVIYMLYIILGLYLPVFVLS